jgi:hypothetical protein
VGRAGDLYWQDFQENDPRYWFTRKLGKVLSLQWLSREMTTHLSTLLEWEVQRTKTGSAPLAIAGAVDISTDPITINEWCRVRDGLVGLETFPRTPLGCDVDSGALQFGPSVRISTTAFLSGSFVAPSSGLRNPRRSLRPWRSICGRYRSTLPAGLRRG